MTAVMQRVLRCSLVADGEPYSEIGRGLLILLGVREGDTDKDVEVLSSKIDGLRIFTDENDKMNRSLADVGGGLLHLGIDSGGLPEPDGGAVALVGQILPKEMALQMSKC